MIKVTQIMITLSYFIIKVIQIMITLNNFIKTLLYFMITLLIIDLQLFENNKNFNSRYKKTSPMERFR